MLEKVFLLPEICPFQGTFKLLPTGRPGENIQYPSNLMKTLQSQILIAIRDPDGMMNRTDKAYRRWAAGFMDECEKFDETDLTLLSDEELLSLYHNIENAGIKHYQLIRYGMGFIPLPPT